VTGSLFALLVLSILSTMVAVPPIMFAEWLFEHYIAPPTNWGHGKGTLKVVGDDGGKANEDGDGDDSLGSEQEPSLWRRALRVLGYHAGSASAADQERERRERAASMRRRVGREMGRVVMTVAEQRLELLAVIARLEEDLGPDQARMVRHNRLHTVALHPSSSGFPLCTLLSILLSLCAFP
jgi:hypothetical protein